uniref:F-box domain-containing protein n=1 Tax=Chenopodium quinoa TaxID=63459 RepID=A0A803LC50_CHEQI
MSFLANLGEQVPSEFLIDSISCLPCKVLNIILEKLPLFDAVRTCVLAKGWRYKWLMLSKLFLDYELISDDTKDLKWDMIFFVTNNYLLNHTGTIKTFYLRTLCWPHYPELYQWLLYLSKLDLEVLLLEELGSQPFEMPSYMFRFKKLRSLFLGNCTLRIPSTIGSFSTLFELSLRDVSINDNDLHHLLLRCPLLVKLTLLRIHGLDHLRIHSPSLTMLEIDTRIEDVVIESFACLVLVCIKNSFRYPGMVRSWRSVICCLSGLDSLQRLVLYGEFITILAADCALENFPLRNDTLICLSLCDVRFETIEVLRIEAAKGPKRITTYLKEWDVL